jgi:hypothetical protein
MKKYRRSTELRTLLQCKMVELYMLKQDKNRKYNCPVQLAVYGHTVEGTIYLTLPIQKSIQEGDGSNFIEECKCFRQQLQNYFFQRKSVDIFPGFTTTCVGESPYS